jgi:phospholipid/cholesterol/gamma-HCH transport system ATP-binding protein
MRPLATPPILSLRGIPPAGQGWGTSPASIDLELERGQLALIEVPDSEAASGLVDLCLGLVDPPAGAARFLDRDWRGQTYHRRLEGRGHIGAVIATRVWPAHLSISEAILMPPLYHTSLVQADVASHATVLARLFDLPGLPAGRRETTPDSELVRAACIRGFLGTPDLVVIHDPMLDGMDVLAVALTQAVASVLDRGGAVIWIVASASAPAARYVQPDQALRLGDRGLVPMRRSS